MELPKLRHDLPMRNVAGAFSCSGYSFHMYKGGRYESVDFGSFILEHGCPVYFFFLELLMLSADPVPQHIVHRMNNINSTSCTEIGHAQ